MPHLRKVASEVENEPVSFFMVTDQPPAKIEPFLKKFEMPGTVALDTDGSTLETFNVTSRPRTIVLDRSGRWLLDIKPKQLTADLLRKVVEGSVRATEVYAKLDPTDAQLGEAAMPPAKFGEFELVSGSNSPIRTGFHGLAAPAYFDFNRDGKKDLLIGEFETGPSMVKVYPNVGTTKSPRFTGEWSYAKTVSGKLMSIDSW